MNRSKAISIGVFVLLLVCLGQSIVLHIEILQADPEDTLPSGTVLETILFPVWFFLIYTINNTFAKIDQNCVKAIAQFCPVGVKIASCILLFYSTAIGIFCQGQLMSSLYNISTIENQEYWRAAEGSTGSVLLY
ncbi:MAG: hypothetical protein AAFO84_00495, partial [Cyanobacteria bacterium J06598_1]